MKTYILFTLGHMKRCQLATYYRRSTWGPTTPELPSPHTSKLLFVCACGPLSGRKTGKREEIKTTVGSRRRTRRQNEGGLVCIHMPGQGQAKQAIYMLKHIYVRSRSPVDNGMRAHGLVALVMSGELDVPSVAHACTLQCQLIYIDDDLIHRPLSGTVAPFTIRKQPQTV